MDQNSKKPTTPDQRLHGQIDDKPDENISTDNFGVPGLEGVPGNGKGDLVLYVHDGGGNSLRKKTLLVDLSLDSAENTSPNDLNSTYFLNSPSPFKYHNSALSEFILQASNVNEIVWQVFSITNDYEPGERPVLKNYGLITTDKTGKNLPKLGIDQLHRAKGIRAQLIIDSNARGAKSNSSLVSFSGEPTAYNEQLHSTLLNNTQTIAKLSQCSTLAHYKLVWANKKVKPSNRFTETQRDVLGEFCLSVDKNQATLKFR